jgi:hypothetical protein
VSPGSAAIGDGAIGDIETLAAFAASGCLPQAKGLFIRNRLLGAFRRRGAENSPATRLDAASGDKSVNILAVWVMTRSEELIGEVRQSDMTVLVHPAAFEGTGFPLPLRKGDRVTRWPLQTRERVHTAIETPAVYAAGDVDLLYRLIVRG